MDFDPDKTVLLEGEYKDNANRNVIQNWKNIPSMYERPPYIEFIKQVTPEVVSLLVSQGGGWLVLADTYFPGWTAAIVKQNGKETPIPIYPAYGVMRAVPLPPNENAFVVEFRYRPMSWRIGSIISAISWALFAILSMGALIRRLIRSHHQ